MSPWALCSCLSALFPRHETGQCAFAQLHPVFIRAGLGWGEAAGLGLGVLPPVPWDSPGSSLGKKKTVPAPQTQQPRVALDANLLQAEIPQKLYLPELCESEASWK